MAHLPTSRNLSLVPDYALVYEIGYEIDLLQKAEEGLAHEVFEDVREHVDRTLVFGQIDVLVGRMIEA